MTGEEIEKITKLRADYLKQRHALIEFMSYLEGKYGGDKWDYWGPANLETEYERV